MKNTFDLLTPSYSLADLFKDISLGNKDEFTYNGRLFKAKRKGIGYIVTDTVTQFTGFQNSYCNSMLDLQGIAACIMEEGRHITFDREGNII